MALSVENLRRAFPALQEKIDGHTLVYLDNAATTQKPEAVLNTMDHFYRTANGNAHRGMHVLAERATVALEDARKKIQKFLNAARPEEIIFTKSCTESINLVAKCLGRTWGEGDAVVLSILEHHSNVVPWLQLKEERGIDVLWIDCDENGELQMDMLEHFLAEDRVKLVAITAQSNVFGVRPPLAEIIAKAHAKNALVLVDAAQSVAHHATDVQALDADFFTFSGHKLYGPLGVGILYGKKKYLESMPPFLGGGMMIHEVLEDRFSPADIPTKFEAGTQPIAEAVGLAAAIDWLTQFSWSDIEAHEQQLLAHAQKLLSDIEGLHILGLHHFQSPISNLQSPSGCISFTLDNIHPHDLTEILGRNGICLRAGHHCTQPLHRKLGIPASTRLSVGIYNTEEEIKKTAEAIGSAQKKFTGKSE